MSRWYCAIWVLGCACWASAHEISGVVVDRDEEPIAEASVWVDQDRSVRKTVTDAHGRFTFPEIQAGPIEIVAWKDGYALGGLDAEVAGSADVVLSLAEPDTVRLRIINQASEPVAGARIKALSVGHTFNVSVEDLADHGFPEPRSDEEGRLTIPNLPKGSSVGFIVYHRSYAEMNIAFFPVGRDVQVLRLARGATLRGRVTTADHAGVERARVAVFRPEAAGLLKFTERLTDPEGFYMAIVPPGAYYVTVKHTDYALSEPQPVSLDDADADNVLDVVLLPPHLIEGSLEGPDGAPAGGVRVAYFIQSAVYAETRTQGDGFFHLKVPGRAGTVHVFPPDGFLTDPPTDIFVKFETPRRVTLDPIRLTPLPEITGTVLGEGDTPEADVVISSLDLAPPVWALTDAEGHFRIRLSHLPFQPETTFRAEHGRLFLRRDFKVTFAKLRPLTVKLRRFRPDLGPRKRPHIGNDLSLLVGKPAPEIVCDVWFNSEPLTLEALRGKVVVLTLWGGFDTAGPTRGRLEELCALYRSFQAVDDVVIVGVHDNGLEPADVKRYINEYGIPFPVGRDIDRFITFQRYKTNVIPQTVLIGKQGTVRYYNVDGRLLELIKGLRREA